LVSDVIQHEDDTGRVTSYGDEELDALLAEIEPELEAELRGTKVRVEA
jgi:hypothetical protein